MNQKLTKLATDLLTRYRSKPDLTTLTTHDIICWKYCIKHSKVLGSQVDIFKEKASELDNYLLSSALTSKHSYKYFCEFASIDPKLIHSLYELNPSSTQERLKLLKVLSIQQAPHDLLAKIATGLYSNINESEVSQYHPFFYPFIDNLPIPKRSNKMLSSSTCVTLSNILTEMNIDFRQEVQVSTYHIDFYLPQEKIGIEFCGPDHFYPGQTQITDQDKYRINFIVNEMKCTFEIIPYFLYMTQDNFNLNGFFLTQLFQRKLLLKRQLLFRENFDFKAFYINKNLNFLYPFFIFSSVIVL